MNSPICNISKPTYIDYPGELAYIFFTPGCNYNCGYCSNSILKDPCTQVDLCTRIDYTNISTVLSKCRDNWVSGIVITGGEPTIHTDLPILLQRIKEYDLKIKLDTNGSSPDMLTECIPYLDYIAMDIKVPVTMYPEFTGYTQLENIRTSIDILRNSKVEYELRTTIITHIHTDEVMHRLGEDIRGKCRYVLQPFIPRVDLPDISLRSISRTTTGRLKEIQKIMSTYVSDCIIRGE